MISNNKPKISVIVPVYNVERYLPRCIDSILNQTFKNIEIIIINDGSTDNSKIILDKYCKNNNNIKLIDKNNEGLSQARNDGLKHASGEFVMFVDSDDWIELDMISVMYKYLVENNSDVIISTYTREYEEKSIPRILHNMNECVVYNEDNIKSDLYRKLVGPIGKELRNPQYLDCLSTVWSKLYRKSIIDNNEIEFKDTKLIVSEDILFNINVFAYATRATFINKPFYHYWKGNKDSLTTVYRPKLTQQWDYLYQCIEDILNKNKESQIFYEALRNRIAISTLGLNLNECSKLNKISKINKIKSIKKILNEDYIKKAIKGLELKYFPIHWRIFYYFNKKGIASGAYLMSEGINLMRKLI